MMEKQGLLENKKKDKLGAISTLNDIQEDSDKEDEDLDSLIEL